MTPPGANTFGGRRERIELARGIDARPPLARTRQRPLLAGPIGRLRRLRARLLHYDVTQLVDRLPEPSLQTAKSSTNPTDPCHRGALVAGDPVLYIIVCGSRPAADLEDYVAQLRADGWDTCVIATPSARKFMHADRLADVSGHVVRYDYKQPDEPDALAPPDVVIVAPATFNTINKWAAGISDTLALGLLNEGVGLGLPIIAVPFPNIALARHPAFRDSVATLRSWGVKLIFDPEEHPLPIPNMGPPAADLFPWPVLMNELVHVRLELEKVRRQPNSR
jgi:hypothetical protein